MAREEVVLIAEDDGMYRETLVARFRDEGFVVVPAATGGEMVEIVRKEHGRISFVLADAWLLPPGDGADLRADADGLGWGVAAVREVRSLYPELRVYGFSNEAPAEVVAWFEEYTCGFFSKEAFGRRRIAETLNSIRDARRAAGGNLRVGKLDAVPRDTGTADLWMRGLFFLLALVVVAAVVGALARVVPWWALGPVLVSSAVLYVIISAFAIRSQDRRNLESKDFMTLVQAALKQLPLVGRLLPKRSEMGGTGKKAPAALKAPEELEKR